MKIKCCELVGAMFSHLLVEESELGRARMQVSSESSEIERMFQGAWMLRAGKIMSVLVRALVCSQLS